jgi:hypothetical protein
MTTTINASTSSGLVNTADTSGIIKLQSNGVTTNALAWVNFNGTGTVAIRSSYNVSSITDNGTGNYTVNFTNALSDANYAVGTETVNLGSTNNAFVRESSSLRATRTTTAYQISVVQTASYTLTDCDYVCVSIFGN